MSNATHPRLLRRSPASRLLLLVCGILVVACVARGVRAQDRTTDPPAVVATDSPLEWLIAFRVAYEGRDVAAYGELLDTDYRFFFSDLDNRRRHPAGFTREDELISARHLFAGFVNVQGQALPAARAIAIRLRAADVFADPEYPDEPGCHALILARLVLTIEFADGGRLRDDAPQAFTVVRNGPAGGSANGWRCARWVEGAAPDRVALVPWAEAVRAAGEGCAPLAVADAAPAPEQGPVAAERLWRAWPNPSRAGSAVSFAYRIEHAGTAVELGLYDVNGRQVARLAPGSGAVGFRVATWDGRDTAGRPAPAGVYFLRARLGSTLLCSRVIRVR